MSLCPRLTRICLYIKPSAGPSSRDPMPEPDAATTIWRNARLATFVRDSAGIGIVEPGVVVARGERIVFAGPEAEAPAAGRVIDCEARWITPALIDCHTHLVHAGNRAREFELRLAGA